MSSLKALNEKQYSLKKKLVAIELKLDGLLQLEYGRYNYIPDYGGKDWDYFVYLKQQQAQIKRELLEIALQKAQIGLDSL